MEVRSKRAWEPQLSLGFNHPGRKGEDTLVRGTGGNREGASIWGALLEGVTLAWKQKEEN